MLLLLLYEKQLTKQKQKHNMDSGSPPTSTQYYKFFTIIKMENMRFFSPSFLYKMATIEVLYYCGKRSSFKSIYEISIFMLKHLPHDGYLNSSTNFNSLVTHLLSSFFLSIKNRGLGISKMVTQELFHHSQILSNLSEINTKNTLYDQ